MKLDTVKFIGLLTILLCFTGGTIAWAAIPQTGIQCPVCHDTGMDKPLLPQYQGPAGCVNCHSSSDSSTTYDLEVGKMESFKIAVPVVVYTDTSAPTNYLSGGNFWWVKGPANGIPGDPGDWAGGADDTKGHNIFFEEPDDFLDYAPGAATQCSGSCHEDLHTVNNMYGTRQGCTKCHMVSFAAPGGFHHADDSNIVVGCQVGDTDGYFRFLSGHMSGAGHGICGIEDEDWEAGHPNHAPGGTSHNEYLGWEGELGSAGGFYNLGHTMTAYCSGCHGNFHEQKCLPDAEPPCFGKWVRHISGARLCSDGLSGCEMAGYTIYNPQAPVARPDLTDWTEPSATVDPVTDLVNCLSCHRAHGSPYPKMLRWDMTDTTGKACTTCHTSLKK